MAFLGVAAVFVTIIAFFPIVFTGRYPRSLFDFVVGVLRWGWRVGFYSYRALGTDRYPPFTLASVEDYPADLHIDYPEILCRWKPLVKWFLAVPHYLILAALVGGNLGGAGDPDIYFGGLLYVLLLIAAVILLFTAAYPKDIFRLVMGINRWGFRVCAYVGPFNRRISAFSAFGLADRKPYGTRGTPIGMLIRSVPAGTSVLRDY